MIRLDRRGFVDDARVVHQKHGPRLLHRKSDTRGTGGVEDVGFTPANIPATDEDHGDEIDPVTVSAFRRGTADAVRGVDAELMRFDEPLFARAGA